MICKKVASFASAGKHAERKMYLRKKDRGAASPYASAARQTDYTGLPPAYTFVGDGEPFLDETARYIENLKQAVTPKIRMAAAIDLYSASIT